MQWQEIYLLVSEGKTENVDFSDGSQKVRNRPSD